MGSREVDMKRVIIYDKNGDHHPRWLPNLKAYLGENGYAVEIVAGVHPDSFWERVKGCSHLFMWNGAEDCYQPVKRICDGAGVQWSVLEVGWFPQSRNWFIDPKGINGDASIMDDDLSWVGRDDFARLEKLRDEYLGDRRWEGSDYVLVPLQLEWDTNIILHSPYRSMQTFINHCEEKFRGERVIFKRHPLDRKNYSTKGSELITGGSFLDYASKAKLVYGINSTCLLEAALMGVPVTVIGNGYMMRHEDDWERLLAALASKQIHVEEKDLKRWIDPVLGIKRKPKVGVRALQFAGEMERAAKSSSADYVPGVSSDYSNVDIVMTDDPDVLREASQCDVVVVVKSLPGLRDEVEHEKDGVVYGHESWAVHWLNALCRGSLRKELIRSRKERVQCFDPELTVVVPCYNHADKLEMSVGSALGQDGVEVEVIVVDDGSSDDVKSVMDGIIAKAGPGRVRLVSHSENKGLAAARNTGFKEAKAEWVIPLDADDELEPGLYGRHGGFRWRDGDVFCSERHN
jgi:hypothetical protein